MKKNHKEGKKHEMRERARYKGGKGMHKGCCCKKGRK
jgi:hypothetical protein